ncbi:MAG: lipase family protein [Chloroflexota bacterium]
MQRPRATRAATLLAATLLAAVVGSAGAVGASPAPLPVVPPPEFYDPRPIAPGPDGALLASLELAAAPGLRQWAILYRSPGPDGTPAAVSGLVLAPAEPPPPGGRPVVVLAHGTTGLGDQCAPSRSLAYRIEMAIAGVQLAARGWTVVATDYVGLGTPGPHAYLDGPLAASAVLDSVRALDDLPEAAPGDDHLFLALSQGGHAVLWAAGAAAADPPRGMTVRGAVAAAPPADLASIAAYVLAPGGDRMARRAALLIAAAWTATEGIRPADVLAPAALPLLERVESDCGIAPRAFPLRPGVGDLPALRAAIERNTPPPLPPTVPLLYLHGDADTVLPVESARIMVERLCAAGSAVDYREVPGADHVGILYAADRIGDSIDWLSARLAGVPAEVTCPAA